MLRLLAVDNWRDLLVLCLLLLGAWQLAGAGTIKAKAHLAPLLIERAWRESLAAGGVPVKPWPWADTWPVARLRAPQQGRDMLVLAGDSGNALAFGPGHALGSATLGSTGLAVIGGHRDTHFDFLRELRRGAPLQLELPDGSRRDYRIAQARVVDSVRQPLVDRDGEELLMLVTCYPFASLRVGGSHRYVVTARPARIDVSKPTRTHQNQGVFEL